MGPGLFSRAIKPLSAVVSLGAVAFLLWQFSKRDEGKSAPATVAPPTAATQVTIEPAPELAKTEPAPAPVVVPVPRPVQKARERIAQNKVAATTVPPAPTTSAGESVKPQVTLATGGESTPLATSADAPPTGLHADFEIVHLMGFQDNSKSLTEMQLAPSFIFSKRHKVVVTQGAKKVYEIASVGESEFLLADTSIDYKGVVAEDFLSLKWGVGVGATLPISEVSQRNNHVTRPHASISVSRKFFGDRVSVGYGPMASYYANRFTTTVSGKPLKHFSLGHALEVGVEIIPSRLQLVLTGMGVYHFNETNVNAASNPATKGEYEYGARLMYQVNDPIALQVGYLHGDLFTKQGRYEVLVFDPTVSNFYVGLAISL